MKILYTHFYTARFGIGGAERVVLNLAHSMKRDFHEEVSCFVNPGGLAAMFREGEIKVYEAPFRKLRTLRILKNLKEAIDHFQPDVIHSHHRYASFLLELFFKNRIPILHTEHVMRQDKRGWIRIGHLATAVHESVRENMIRHYGISPSRVVTIPNAVTLPPPDPVVLQRLQQEYPRGKVQSFALCIGRLEEQKGHVYLMDAVSRLSKEDRQRIKIFLAGDGSLVPRLKHETKKMGLQENFVFLGYTNQISELLALCDFLVLPSLWEGMPLSVLEAYSAAKPVIATDIPGSRESVRVGETGFLVPVRNAGALTQALLKFMNEPTKRLAMGQQGYVWWEENFSFRRMTEQYHQLYQDLNRSHGR